LDEAAARQLRRHSRPRHRLIQMQGKEFIATVRAAVPDADKPK